jgi:hypothetical protein
LGPLPGWKDRLLEFAYTLYVEGMCECGRPKSECRNEDNAGLYEVADVTCYAQAAIEGHTGQAGFKPEPGQRFYAAEIDGELVTRRTFAPLPDTDYRSDESGEGNKRSEPA